MTVTAINNNMLTQYTLYMHNFVCLYIVHVYIHAGCLQVHKDNGKNCLNFKEGHGARVIDSCPSTANKSQQVMCEGNSECITSPQLSANVVWAIKPVRIDAIQFCNIVLLEPFILSFLSSNETQAYTVKNKTVQVFIKA